MSTNIYTVLSSKPHNKHYLDRYYLFISSCRKNKGSDTELHHICPKEKGLFPEYSDLRANEWNGVYLTFREHLIAHWMLAKAYGGGQIYAFNCMAEQWGKGRTKGVLSRTYEIAKKLFKEEERKRKVGYTNAVDSEGNSIIVSTEEFHLREDLRGNRKGMTMRKNIHTGERRDFSKNDHIDTKVWVSVHSKWIYHTPRGSDTNIRRISSLYPEGGNIGNWCSNPESIFTRQAANACNGMNGNVIITDYMIGKTHRECGFYRERI